MNNQNQVNANPVVNPAQITRAALRCNTLLASHVSGLPNAATHQEFAQAESEKTVLALAAAPAHPAPAWAAAYFDQLNQRFDGLAANMTRLIIITERNYNASCGEGLNKPYHIVPLADGSLPTAHPRPNNAGLFPPLVNGPAIRALDGPLLTDYLTLYGVPHQPSLELGRYHLAKMIGVSYQL
ncbi:hypothetical protein BOTBODRAFT_458254 [Botryobasidium botryosum FD-172 SS1]|uniref:Mug135-like C-terminal domain-containing protein n=1 Tax=Botryobasidium botryosum (strain FD-172 SS1) TaxID=930990 RepID=A0A067M9I8_BOTB1|nr:hypothetical protein BOTBODRAFT_458254 [Botryobasidium botryosum FD-172 SS1]